MKKKKKNILNIILIIITIIFIAFINLINILPTIYSIIISGIVALLTTIILIIKKKKKKLKYILSIILIIIYFLSSYYLVITKNYFKSFEKEQYNEDTYLVIVNKNSKYNKLTDLENQNIGYINNELKDVKKILNILDEEITIQKKEYTDYNKLFEDLDKNNIKSILIDENYYNIKLEEDITSNYKIIHEIKTKNIIKNTTKEVDITKDTFTIYISGIDTYGNIETISRSDVNILITVNPTTKQVLLTSIPRDSYVKLPQTKGYKDKLTHAGNYGIEMSINTIKELLNIDINYYIRVNFTTLEKIINALDGIDVYSEYQFISYIDNYQFYKGYNHMNGKQALAFSRERKSLPNGDIDRGKNQEAVIDGIIRKITSKEIIYNYSTILKETKNTFQTNLTDKDITSLIKKELTNIGGWNITSTTITGTGKLDYTYSYPNQKLYVMEINNNSLNATYELINKVINGNILNSSYDNPENIKTPSKIEIIEQKEEQNKEEKKEEIKKTEETEGTEETKNPLEDILPSNDNDNNDNQNQNQKENNQKEENWNTEEDNNTDNNQIEQEENTPEKEEANPLKCNL